MADLPSRTAAPVYVISPTFTWTGFYIGGTSGGSSPPITLWQAPFEVFTTSSGPITGVEWNRGAFDQSNDPIALGAETPASSYVTNGLNNYSIELTAEDWEGDQQAITFPMGTTGPISLPFDFTLGSRSSSSEGFAMWWSASATAGTYDINFEAYTENPDLVSSATPALSLSGNVIALETAVADPTGWAYANNSNYLVLLYGTETESDTKNINIQIFNTSGQALTQSIVAASNVPLTTEDSIFASSATGFVLVQTAVDGTEMEFTPINVPLGTLGSPVFQTISNPEGAGSDSTTIESYSLRTLTNGDILEFVESLDTTGATAQQDITTRLLNSSFVDITASTSSFSSTELDAAYDGTFAHWQIVILGNGDIILAEAVAGVVSIAGFDANGNYEGAYSFYPNPSGSTQPSDFDNLVAMGSRFEITYRMPDAADGGNTEFAVIYDTATEAYNFTIDDANGPTGEYVGTPFNDTVTYGPGVNEINGGGGSDTFIATNFSSTQVSVVVNAQGNVVLSDGTGDVDTLERFSTIELSDSTIAISGTVLTQTFTSGLLQDTDAVDTYDSNGNLASTRYDVFGGGIVDGLVLTLNETTNVSSGGRYVDVFSGGFTSRTLVSSGGLDYVYDNGVASGTQAFAGGAEFVEAGGLASGAILSGGDEYVLAGGTASGLVASSGGAAFVYGSAVNANFLLGAFADVFSGGTASGMAISSFGVDFLYGGGTASGTRVLAGGAEFISSGGQTTGTLLSGGVEYVLAGGIVSGLIGSAGGLFDSGSAVSATLLSGVFADVFSGGVASGTAISSFGVDFVYGGGIASGTQVLAGGIEVVSSGGLASGTVLSGGVEYVLSGGVTSGLVASAGGIFDYGSAVGGSIQSGVFMDVLSGATASGVTVSSGGVAFVYAGGVASGTQVVGGGVEVVSSGGIDSGTTLSGGTELLTSGGVLNGTLSFSGGGLLIVDQASNFGAGSLVAGFNAPGDVLDLTNVAFGSNPKVGFVEAGNNQSGTLTVSANGVADNITLIGQYTAGSFASAFDGTGGTYISSSTTGSDLVSNEGRSG